MLPAGDVDSKIKEPPYNSAIRRDKFKPIPQPSVWEDIAWEPRWNTSKICFFSFWGEQGTETLPLLMIFWFLGISYGSSLILNSPAELSFWNQLNPQPNL